MGEQKKAKISDLIPDNKNYNKGNALGNKLIEKSLRNLGAGRSILLDKNNRIIAGNKTIENATSIGLDDIIIVETTGDQIVAVKRTDIDLDSKKGREMALADNATAKQNIEWDEKALCADWSIDEQKEWGITDFVIEPEVQEDEYQIPNEIKTDIKFGDVFDIGNHRLICGDSTSPEIYKTLFGDKKADLVLTDPPYNTGMTGHGKSPKAWLSGFFHDSFTPEEFDLLISKTLSNAINYTQNDCAFYVFIDWKKQGLIKDHIEKFIPVKNIIIWDKMVHGLGSDYKYTYELIIYGKKGSPTINNRYELEYQDIWRVQRKMGRDKEHATKKPVELLCKPINHASQINDIVLDSFLGSGSTMVACEQLKRRCFGVELDPRYCAVILERMSSLTPGIALKKNGEPYKLK